MLTHKLIIMLVKLECYSNVWVHGVLRCDLTKAILCALKKLMLRSHILRIKNHSWSLLLLRTEYSASFNTKQCALFETFFYSVLALVNNEKLYKTITLGRNSSSVYG